MGRKPCFSGEGLSKGPWTPEEDFLLVKYIQAHGIGRWRTIPRNAGLNRCGKSCRFRWMNYLRPDIKRGHISAEEEELIIRLHNILGNRWSLIARRMPGRTDNEVKNYWNTHLRKRFKESSANELINAEVDNIHMLNHNSITTTQGYSNEMACMEPYDSNTEMGAAQFDCNRLFQFDCNGVVEVEGENQIGQNAGFDSLYDVHGSSCLSSLNWTCDQSIEGMEWSVGDLQALLLGYELGTAHRFLP